MKGFVLGPIHNNEKDDLAGTNLEQINPALGSKEDFENLLQSAKKKSGCPGIVEEASGKGLAWPQERQDRVFVWFTPAWLSVFLRQVQVPCGLLGFSLK